MGCDLLRRTSLWTTPNFNPRTPCGVRLLHKYLYLRGERIFQSTHPVWGATRSTSPAPLLSLDFNPRTPCGVRPRRTGISQHSKKFQSTHPVWGATLMVRVRVVKKIFQSTHPVWGATGEPGSVSTARKFQSTHPVWGATQESGMNIPSSYNFNPRTPCGVRQWSLPFPSATLENFNPRTPCGVRRPSAKTLSRACDFNPRTPCGVRLWTMMGMDLISPISIHAPRVGCDSGPSRGHILFRYFNPRTPCGVRLYPPERFGMQLVFQSTHPVWGATRA